MALNFYLILIIAVLVVVLILIAKFALSEREEERERTKELEKKNELIAYLYKHAEELAKINAEKDQLQEEINNAKTDAEIASIIAAVVDTNNNKLRE